ncbi:penicillin-binding protein 2A [Pelagirhabdus alkalitolerans]|uniref:Penicillin-binding protein 2A n=1 Tax=Pelagirhabdus alkalitolerans TaxID=1612202 RepID=A0A1G6LMG3_9BACI|nr:transglycosylase domain-containing protein [Pelagirhabdus alkalitolerans]SDC44379.1 penicillin-binding protein 2A [Pelagirhabdus alkalitolerans]
MKKQTIIQDLYHYIKMRTWLKVLVISLSAVFLISLSLFLFIIYGGGLIVDEEALVLPATTSVVTEDEEYAGRLFTQNRSLVSLDEIPEHVQKAFIAVEDERFYSHAGVDFRSVVRAMYRDLIAFDKVEGASTITQQLAKNLFLDNTQSWMRKTKEVMASIYLERHYTKDDILELYLNEVYFAHGIFGVDAAAEYFFNKPVGDLSISEGAMLAGMVKGPNMYSPYVDEERALNRRNLVLAQMERTNVLDTNERLALQGQSLNVTPQSSDGVPWIDDYLEAVIREAEDRFLLTREELQRGGYTVTVHMDTVAQQTAYDLMQDDAFFYGSTDDVEAAFTMIDAKTGHLSAVIGGRDYKIGDEHRAFNAHQPGSVMKPLAVYGPALEEGYTPYQFVDDEQNDFDGYRVQNVDQVYDGDVTMYDALARSKNTSAVWLLDQIGVSTGKNYLEKMNLTLPDEGLSIALGGIEQGFSPIQIAEGYRTFINNGQFQESYTIKHIVDRDGNEVEPTHSVKQEQVFSPQASWDMVRMLEGVVNEGTAQAGDFNKALAGKTGTTEHPHAPGNAKDAWFTGLTPEYVTTLWMGYDRSDADHYLTRGSAAPTELTKAILTEIDQQQTLSETFTSPDGIKDLPEPIRLPNVDDLEVDHTFGGWRLIRGELTWTPAEDERIEYHVYQEQPGDDELLGTVEGTGTFNLNDMGLFSENHYYVIPYNPLTEEYGNPSNTVRLSLFNE